MLRPVFVVETITMHGWHGGPFKGRNRTGYA